MFERENREDRSRPRSLLALGPDARAQQKRSPSVSLLSVADEVASSGDAVERHRAARELREAQSAPPADETISPYSAPVSFYEPPADQEELPSPAWQNPIEALRSAIKRAVSRKGHEAVYEEIDQHSYEESFGEENFDGFDDAPVFAPDVQSAEDPMYPVYPDPNAPYVPQPAMGFPQPQFQQPYPQAPHYPAAPQMMPQQVAPYPAPQMHPHPYAQPYPYAQPPQQQMTYPQQAQAWQMPQHAPPPVYPHAPPMPQQAYAQPQQFSQQRPPEMQAMPAPAEETMPIEEIRASLREFRDAVRDLVDSRSRRRYF
jgi:hypothetical protein